MKLNSLLTFSKRPEEAAVHGRLTGCNLADVAPLCRPFARDAFQRLRPPFSEAAQKLSLELSDTAYTLDLEPWQSAGWGDFSVLIDDSLQTGMNGLDGTLKLLRAKASLIDLGPVTQVLGALRQKERSDTVKAVCMMHALADGQWLLAIGFMGTGKHVADWISNLRFTPEEGFHRGFYQLCQSFESYAERIVFPGVAAAMGLERLTLGDVLSDLRSLKSPFRLWMAGHSQGSAVMQVFAHRLINDWHIAPQNMVGYGFASPTVATGRFVYDPAAYPLYHIINRADFVPRMGALLHLGLCMESRGEYGVSGHSIDPGLRDRLAFLAQGMTDTPSILLRMRALVECLAQEKGAEALTELLNVWWSFPAMDRMLWRAGDKAAELMRQLIATSEDAYLALTGEAMPGQALSRLLDVLRPIVRETTVRRLVAVLGEYALPPHMLSRAYAPMAAEGLAALVPFVWQKRADGLPSRRYAAALRLTDASALAVPLRARRGAQHPAPLRSKLRISYGFRRFS